MNKSTKAAHSKLKQLTRIHFIGIGGSGMSGLAKLLKEQNKKITGSDLVENQNTISLKKIGVKITIGQTGGKIPEKIDIVIYSPAVPEANPERIKAGKLKIPEFSYPQAVGLLTKEKSTISICGTHGKTTTTAMAAAVFMLAKKDPSVIVGATIKELNHSNAHTGKGPDLILESCEYRRGFLNYEPKTIIITNIEADHLDYYKNLADYKKAFVQFIQKLPKDGLVIANSDDKNIISVLKQKHKARIIWYGKAKSADYRLKNGSVWHNKSKLFDLTLQIPGIHNLMNATAVVALASEYKLPMTTVKKALENYSGSSRRFEKIGTLKKAIVIDDYGHHPTEIKATLKAARDQFGKKAKILCIFQPHQLSRTYKLLDGFSQAFKNADTVIIPNIYSVRDTAEDSKKMDTDKLVAAIQKHHPNVRNGNGFKNTINTIKNETYDVIITMGAGDVYQISKKLTKLQKNLK